MLQLRFNVDGRKQKSVGRNVWPGGVEESMTDFNHPKIQPSSMTIKELTHWGEDHPDPWVKAMSTLLADVHSLQPLDGFSAEEFHTWEDKIRDAERETEWAEDDAESARADRDRAEIDRDAAKYDLLKTEQDYAIKTLKARLLDKEGTINALAHELTVTRSNFNELHRTHKELQERYNTFRILAAP